MSDIFISYKSEDKAKAEVFATALEQEGWSVFWDRDIPPGSSFDKYIGDKLAGAKCVLVLWSAKSVASNWVKEEAQRGASREILIPIFIEKVRLPLGFGRIEAAELVDWNGDVANAEYQNLVEAIEVHLGRRQEGAPAPAPAVKAPAPIAAVVEEKPAPLPPPAAPAGPATGTVHRPSPSEPRRRSFGVGAGIALALIAVVVVIFAFKMFRDGGRGDPPKPRFERTVSTKPKVDPGVREDKWGLKTPAFVIASGAFKTETRARAQRDALRSKGYQAGYLWIPDYESLSGKELYAAFVGPFASKEACKKALDDFRKFKPDAYGVLVAHAKKRVEVR